MTPLEWWGYADRGARMTEKDRLLVLALRDYEAGICAGCGHHKTESMDPAHDGSEDSVATYVVGTPWECLACAALGRAQATFAKSLGEDGHRDHGEYQWSVALISNDALTQAD